MSIVVLFSSAVEDRAEINSEIFVMFQISFYGIEEFAASGQAVVVRIEDICPFG
jgi:hypothetical protein